VGAINYVIHDTVATGYVVLGRFNFVLLLTFG
jgi:hypothetical protein